MTKHKNILYVYLLRIFFVLIPIVSVFAVPFKQGNNSGNDLSPGTIMVLNSVEAFNATGTNTIPYYLHEDKERGGYYYEAHGNLICYQLLIDGMNFLGEGLNEEEAYRAAIRAYLKRYGKYLFSDGNFDSVMSKIQKLRSTSAGQKAWEILTHEKEEAKNCGFLGICGGKGELITFSAESQTALAKEYEAKYPEYAIARDISYEQCLMDSNRPEYYDENCNIIPKKLPTRLKALAIYGSAQALLDSVGGAIASAHGVPSIDPVGRPTQSQQTQLVETIKEGAQSFTLKESPKLRKPSPRLIEIKGTSPEWRKPGHYDFLSIPAELTKTTSEKPTKLLRTLSASDFEPSVASEAQITHINMLKHKGWKFGTFTAKSPEGETLFMVDGPSRPIHVENGSPQLVGANKNRFAQRLNDLNPFLKRLYGDNTAFVDEQIAITNHPTKDFVFTPAENNVVNLNLVDVLEGRGKDAAAHLAVERKLLTDGDMAPSSSYYEDALGRSNINNLTIDEMLRTRGEVIEKAKQGATEAQVDLLHEEVVRQRYYAELATAHQKDGILQAEQENLGNYTRADGIIDFVEAARIKLKDQGIDITDDAKTTFYRDNRYISNFYF